MQGAAVGLEGGSLDWRRGFAAGGRAQMTGARDGVSVRPRRRSRATIPRLGEPVVVGRSGRFARNSPPNPDV